MITLGINSSVLELIIGNFRPRNPTRCVTEVAICHPHHRMEAELIALAQMAGEEDVGQIRNDTEAEEINLFMWIGF